MGDIEMESLVKLIQRRAGVPRVRSSEIRKIVEALQSLSREGVVSIEGRNPS